MAQQDKLERTHIKEAFEKKAGTKVRLAGWVHDTRALGKVRFLVLRDITGRIQTVAFKGETPEEAFEKVSKINRESVVMIEGVVKDSKQAPGGKEILIENMEVISVAEQPLPIDVSDFSKTELPKRLDYRFLDLHRERIQAIFKIQSTISMSFREYFVNKGHLEFQPPSIIGTSSEGGTELFTVQYFEKKAYLAQSPQLYKQMFACSMGKCVTITPVWRAEKHNTTRHLNESRQMDIEIPFASQMEVMKELELAVRYIVEKVLEKNKKEVDVLGLKLKVPDAHYLSYDEIVKMFNLKYGEDLSPDDEKKICAKFKDDIVFVHSWPTNLRGFYIMRKNADPEAKLTEGFDALYGGIEISSGGQRIHIPELLIERIKAKKLNPKNFKDYIDSFRFGAPPHAGWSIGLERITQIICGLDNIKEATMFPRDRERLTP